MLASSGHVIGIISAVALSFIVQLPSGIIECTSDKSLFSRRLMYLLMHTVEERGEEKRRKRGRKGREGKEDGEEKRRKGKGREGEEGEEEEGEEKRVPP
jgi:hypothetical protein